MKIGIIGAGFMGMSLATKLSMSGNRVTVFEKSDQLGGLATYQDYNFFYWDRFYHVILPSDSFLISFLKEIGLESELRWNRTLTGYYVNRRFYSISSTKEFLFFPPLNLINKIRLAYTIYYGSKVKDWQKLEQVTIKDWLIKMGGIKNYEKFWKPLLLAKLGENYHKVSAVFIWTYIKRLFEARQNSNHQEQMGYVKGGYKAVFERLEQIITNNHGLIRLTTSVEKIGPSTSGGLLVSYQRAVEEFDKVIFTGPTTLMETVVEPTLVNVEQKNKLQYLGVVCLVLLTKKEFTPYYVLNIADPRVPFTGVIGMSSLVETSLTDEKHITYFPKYIDSKDPMLNEEDELLKQQFLEGVFTMYPELSEQDIVSVHIHKAKRVQPLQVLNYSKQVPRIVSKNKDFYVLNTSQFVNDTLNNNSVSRHVQEFMSEFGDQF